MQKKITLATFKKFIRDNKTALHIRVTSKFDGMTDGCESVKDATFTSAAFYEAAEHSFNHTLGIAGVWLVGSSRDSFEAFEGDGFTGIRVYNCCGSFTLAIPSAPVAAPVEAFTEVAVAEAAKTPGEPIPSPSKPSNVLAFPAPAPFLVSIKKGEFVADAALTVAKGVWILADIELSEEFRRDRAEELISACNLIVATLRATFPEA